MRHESQLYQKVYGCLLGGALGGAQSLPAPWVEQVLRLNPQPDLPRMAEELCEVIIERARRQQRHSADLLSLT